LAGGQSDISGIAERYASALFALALEGKAIGKVLQDLDVFAGMIDQSADLQRLISSPVFSANEQAGAIAALALKAKITGLTANFLGLVAKNRRLFVISGMIKAFRNLVADHRGEVTADVTSASALTPAQVKSLKTILDSAVGKKVQIAQNVDPAILGGMIVKVGSRMIDTTIRTKLDNLKIAMKEVG
jgi:F-type H+-transporting ATPase subunit delta